MFTSLDSFLRGAAVVPRTSLLSAKFLHPFHSQLYGQIVAVVDGPDAGLAVAAADAVNEDGAAEVAGQLKGIALSDYDCIVADWHQKRLDHSSLLARRYLVTPGQLPISVVESPL